VGELRRVEYGDEHGPKCRSFAEDFARQYLRRSHSQTIDCL
jgi:hypothetical protein